MDPRTRNAVRSAQRNIPTLLEQGRLTDALQILSDATFTVLLKHHDRLDRHHGLLRQLYDAFEDHEQNMQRSVQEVANSVYPAVAEKFEEVCLHYEQAAAEKDKERRNMSAASTQESQHRQLPKIARPAAKRASAKVQSQAETKEGRAGSTSQGAGEQGPGEKTAEMIVTQDSEVQRRTAHLQSSENKMMETHALVQSESKAARSMHEESAASVALERDSNHDKSSLHLALTGGHVESVKLLLTKGTSDLQAHGYTSDTLLHHASRNGHLELTKYLVLEAGADAEVFDNDCNNPLHLAVLGGHLEVVKFLVTKAYSNLERIGSDGLTPLLVASSNGHLDIVEYLLLEGRADVNYRFKHSNVLHFAAGNGHLEIVKFLVTQAPSHLEAPGQNGSTPLLAASYAGHLDVVNYLLLEARADIEARNYSNVDALHCAAANGHLEIVKFLLTQAHSHLEAPGQDGCTPLIMASYAGHLDVVSYLLLEARADIEARAYSRDTSLHIAAMGGHSEMVKLMVTEAHADVDTPGNFDRTCLHLAALQGHLTVVEFLCREAAANALAEDSRGFTPFTMVSWAHHKSFNSIELHGAKDQEEVALVRALKSVKDFLQLWVRKEAAGTL